MKISSFSKLLLGALSVFGIHQQFEYPKVSTDFKVHFESVGKYLGNATNQFYEQKIAKEQTKEREAASH